MKILFLSLFTAVLFSCACPAKDVHFILAVGGYPVSVVIKKGEFSCSEEERGYKLFDSLEELQDYMMSLYMDRQKGI